VFTWRSTCSARSLKDVPLVCADGVLEMAEAGWVQVLGDDNRRWKVERQPADERGQRIYSAG
jgi:hypothetical protein